MNDFIRQLRHQEKLHRKSGANGLADLFMNAAKELGQQQIDKSVLEQELETTNRHLRLANRKVNQQHEELERLRGGIDNRSNATQTMFNNLIVDGTASISVSENGLRVFNSREIRKQPPKDDE